jgi:hypothetical protein
VRMNGVGARRMKEVSEVDVYVASRSVGYRG